MTQPAHKAFHLPRGIPEPPLETRTFHRLAVRTPVIDAAFVTAVCKRLAEARRPLLRMTTDRILLSLERTAEHLEMFDDGAATRLDALASRLSAATGWPESMAADGIRQITCLLRRRNLSSWLAGEVHPSSALAGPARGPEVIFHVLAGAVPYPTVMTLTAGLLARSGNLVKPSSADPVFAADFARALAENDPDLGDALAVIPWAGGSSEIEDAALRSAGAVTAYGGDDAVASLRARTPAATRVLAHPHKFSIAVLAGADPVSAAAGAVADVLRFDLSGCLSPQVFFVEGDPLPFAEALAARLAADSEARAARGETWDRPHSDIGTIRRSREKAEFAELSDRPVRMLASDNLDWTVVVQLRPLRPFHLFGRTVNVVGVGALRETADLLGPSVRQLSCCGLAAADDRWADAVEFLVGLGVRRVCPLGKMQTPPLGWHHDGRFHLADFLEWTDVETASG
jgi:hypothetical protein